ncbi:hypothetical protein FHE66_04410 [Georgenia sp. 311]|uniref:DUF2231 domain-containing protein n=1 Tax=Georgenia wutianyii TaxID=2585135 RepID=A0ABX5VLU3_9MICO|nr:MULTISPECIES: DUF2231 domain-containing protein [Georgenia]QDB79173.1 hypothetical protein FE251_07150 [Georgenia wutianyii]TNC19159.1 hypothetical protein FHE66_04410 [Georgenia sp. 311]
MTAPGSGSPGARVAEAIEQDERLDAAVQALSGPVQVLASVPGRDLLLGKPLGHALHPMMTDLPIGFWTSATVLDLLPVPGGRRASQRLIALGLMAAVPTALSGWAEWGQVKDPGSRRAGVVHAGANGAAAVLFAGSWLARRSGRHRSGVVLGGLGALAASAGGALGGHLAIGKKVGSTFTATASA